jgi:hypothetical protein
METSTFKLISSTQYALPVVLVVVLVVVVFALGFRSSVEPPSLAAFVDLDKKPVAKKSKKQVILQTFQCNWTPYFRSVRKEKGESKWPWILMRFTVAFTSIYIPLYLLEMIIIAPIIGRPIWTVNAKVQHTSPYAISRNTSLKLPMFCREI